MPHWGTRGNSQDAHLPRPVRQPRWGQRLQIIATKPDLSPVLSKARLLTPGCGEGKSSVCLQDAPRAAKCREGQLVPKRPGLPEGLQGKVFKPGRGRGFRVRDRFVDVLRLGGDQESTSSTF